MLINSSKPIAEDDLNFIAKNIYNLNNNEYDIVKFNNNFSIDIKTDRVINSFMRLDIITSGLYAALTLLPPINNGQLLKEDDVIEKIKTTYNIRPDLIDEPYLSTLYKNYMKQEIIFKEIVAEGKPPKEGSNALVKIFFDISVSKPKILANGKVDYKDLTSYVFAKQGDTLLKRIPPTAGESGYSVTGAELPPAPGKDKVINALDGVLVNEDQTEYKASIAGQIVFANSSIKINPFLVIPGNVDYKTGNIKFLGTVDISGDALTGFTIDAEDIILHGIDEDAILIAKNSVIIKTGVKGASKKGTITAGSDVIVGYCENAVITAEHLIEVTKYCFNSKLTADIIKADGKDSLVVGGKLEAFSEISLNNVGSKGSNDTLLAVGIRTDFIEKSEKLSSEIEQLKESLDKMKDVLSKVDLNDKRVLENPKVKKIIEAMALLKKRLPLLTTKRDEYNKNSTYETPVIKVAGTIYPGVKLQFFNTFLTITTNMNRVRFFYDKATNEIQFSIL